MAPVRLPAVNPKLAALLVDLPPDAVCGLDEVGRGPLAGPVTAGCLVLTEKNMVGGLNDSKALSPARRAVLSDRLRQSALAWGLGWVWPNEIERLNIHHAGLLAMRRAFQAMAANQSIWPSLAVVDGKFCPELPIPAWAQIKGDALIAAVSAASIIAKVARDRWMTSQACQYPDYGFESHKGYPTPQHLQALKRFGPCPIHRKTWAENALRGFFSKTGQPFVILA